MLSIRPSNIVDIYTGQLTLGWEINMWDNVCILGVRRIHVV